MFFYFDHLNVGYGTHLLLGKLNSKVFTCLRFMSIIFFWDAQKHNYVCVCACACVCCVCVCVCVVYVCVCEVCVWCVCVVCECVCVCVCVCWGIAGG